MSDQPADMTAREARDACRALEREVGEQADVSVHLASYSEHALLGTIYPRGICRGGLAAETHGNTFREVIDGLRVAWEAHRVEARRKTVIEMAVAIIRITDSLGECSDAALRAEFARQDVEDCGADACAKADEMAGRGPFKIVAAAKANAPGNLDAEAA